MMNGIMVGLALSAAVLVHDEAPPHHAPGERTHLPFACRTVEDALTVGVAMDTMAPQRVGEIARKKILAGKCWTLPPVALAEGTLTEQHGSEENTTVWGYRLDGVAEEFYVPLTRDPSDDGL